MFSILFNFNKAMLKVQTYQQSRTIALGELGHCIMCK